ncbi:two-component system response regulator RppA [Oscillatoria sp. FACHB-1406]|uniref:two-component system response regulator RppA n=1 Tax=Oscillatoria sp. FACHB-1406 TaxID=2692846 RepID=UPI001682E97C|nr:two-component system response regulator RppA [Oscillatoria sp. FACHB-1406]MBD2579180.1 response regulator transcription factor [Oscillatoria sp. FACHB-1406]
MRILLVEDEFDLGEAIKRVLLQERYIVDWATDGQMAWNYLDCGDFSYAIAVLDWLLPGLSGLTLLQRMRDRGWITPVLMLTARDRMADKIAGLDAGADDYLVKPFQMEELLARLRALQRRSPHLEPQILRVGSLYLDCGTRTVTQHNPNQPPRTVELTNKEYQLLEYLMRHPNQVLNSEQIRNQLWEVGAEAMSNVVAAQMRLLRRKLESCGVEVPIETVRGLGYRLKSYP